MKPDRKFIARAGVSAVLLCGSVIATSSCSSVSLREPNFAGPRRVLDKKLYYKRTYKDLPRAHAPADGRDPRIAYEPGVVREPRPAFITRDKHGRARIQGEFLVVLKRGHTDVFLRRDLEKAGLPGALIGYVPTFRVVQLLVDQYHAHTLDKIRRLPSVQSAHRHHVHRRRQMYFNRAWPPWHIRDYGLAEIWKKSTGRGIRLAILDSGMSLNIPAFKGRIRFPYSVLTRSPDFVRHELKRGHRVESVLDHGTAVASVAAALAPAGGPDIFGTAPHAEIMPIQVIGRRGKKGRMYTSDLAILEGIARALAYRARVINISLGVDYSIVYPPPGPNHAIRLRRVQGRLIKYAAASRKIYDLAFAECARLNVPVVVAAGNDGLPATVQPLVSHPYTIVAGAVDAHGIVSGFSNHGPRVDVNAPGSGLRALNAKGRIYNYYGTSFSAPFVSGLIALALSLKPELTPAKIKAALRSAHKPLRMSVLPDHLTRVFHTGAFLKDLGINMTAGEKLTTRMHFRALRFRSKYHDLFARKGEDERAVIMKVVRYMERRMREKSSGGLMTPSPEWNYLRDKAPAHLDFFLAMFERPRKIEVGTIVASALGRARLSAAQMERIADALKDSDELVAAIRDAKYRPALPRLYTRLRIRDDNWTTLYCLDEMDFPGSREAFPRYAKRLREKYRGLHLGEVLVFHLLTRRRRYKDRYLEPLLKTYRRFRAVKGPTGAPRWMDPWNYSYFLALDWLSNALYAARRRENLKLLLIGMERLDAPAAERPPILMPDSERSRIYYHLNTRLGRELRLDENASPEKRKAWIKRLRTLLPRLRLDARGRKWVLPAKSSGAEK